MQLLGVSAHPPHTNGRKAGVLQEVKYWTGHTLGYGASCLWGCSTLPLRARLVLTQHSHLFEQPWLILAWAPHFPGLVHILLTMEVI